MKVSKRILTTFVPFFVIAGQNALAAECRPGAIETRTACHQLSTVGSWDGQRHGSASCTYNPDPGWVIIDHQVIVHSSNNGSQEVNTIAGGSNFASESDLKQAYDSLQRAAAEYTDPKTGQSNAYSAEIEKRYNSHIREVRNFQATHNTLQAIVRASAHGNEYFDKKRGWQVIDVVARVRCLGEPDPAKLKEQIAKDMNMPIGSDLYFRNKCPYKVRMVVRYKTLSGPWDTAGWYEFDANKSGYLSKSDSGTARIMTNNMLIYYYAENMDGTAYHGGSREYEFDSRTIRLFESRVQKDKDGDIAFAIECENPLGLKW